MRIDLHVHSSASDGTDAPAEVVRRARDAGLDVLSLTDHDTQAGLSAAAGTVRSPADAFTADWIADGGRASVDRYAPGLLRAVGLVRAAGGVPVIAHPRSPGYEIPDEAIVTLAAAGLAGLEVFHIDHDEEERARLTQLATTLDLIMTGGSDDHGFFNNHGLGTETTPPDQYDRIVALAGTRP